MTRVELTDGGWPNRDYTPHEASQEKEEATRAESEKWRRSCETLQKLMKKK